MSVVPKPVRAGDVALPKFELFFTQVDEWGIRGGVSSQDYPAPVVISRETTHIICDDSLR